MLVLPLLAGCLVLTQVPTPPPEEGPDTLFQRARALAGQGRREEARALCRRALARSPDYHDVRIYLGRLHAWDAQYEPGREALKYVLDREGGNLEAREAWIDLETWAGSPRAALGLCDEGLRLTPRNDVLLYRRARLLKSMGDLPGAMAAVRLALAANPDHQPARLLRDDLHELAQRAKVGLSATRDTFDKTFEPWSLVSLSGSYRFDGGSLIARVNRATRFGSRGTQFEMDAYPRLREGTYLYLNAGTSGDAIFPTFRSGAEVYHNFSGGIEASLGFRQLRFSESSVTIYTGSLGQYAGNQLYTLRLNVTPSSVGSSLSGALSARHYLEDADSYLSASVGTGVSPDQAGPTAEILRLRSQRASLGFQKKFGPSLILSAGVALERQEIGTGEYRQMRTLTLGLERRF
jgi:YaiO family outer membrane protein